MLTFLVVPVLAAEQVGPIDAVKRSGTLLRKTWGEQLIGGSGIGVVFGLMTIAVIVLGGILTAVLASISGWLAVIGILAIVLAVAAVSLVGGALGGIYTASLYRYATTGETGAFDAEAMAAAFKQKSGGVGGLMGRTR